VRIAQATVAALVAMVAPAAADPQPRCEVRFVRAPDDVRHVIETWLDAEPRCTSTIELRVISTEHGYYLLAQRPDGRIHERLVPDAQSAGVLVASWVADDWVAPKGVSAPRPAAAPIAAPPHMRPSETPAVTAISAPRPRRDGSRWLSLATMWADDEGRDGGLRAELDLITRGSWTLGASLAWAETTSIGGSTRNNDYWSTAYGAYTMSYGRWDIRLGSALGVVYSDVNDMTGSISPHATGVGVVFEAHALATCRIGDRWGITAGLLASWLYQSLTPDTEPSRTREDAHMMFVAGLRRRI
jgi:hypothetical protein